MTRVRWRRADSFASLLAVNVSGQRNEALRTIDAPADGQPQNLTDY